MTWDEINDWFDAFYAEYVEGRKPVRGRVFSGSHIEIWGRNSIAIVLHDPYPRGQNEEQKALDFVRTMNDNNVNVQAEIDYGRLDRIIKGQETLTEDDWVWDDE